MNDDDLWLVCVSEDSESAMWVESIDHAVREAYTLSLHRWGFAERFRLRTGDGEIVRSETEMAELIRLHGDVS